MATHGYDKLEDEIMAQINKELAGSGLADKVAEALSNTMSEGAKNVDIDEASLKQGIQHTVKKMTSATETAINNSQINATPKIIIKDVDIKNSEVIKKRIAKLQNELDVLVVKAEKKALSTRKNQDERIIFLDYFGEYSSYLDKMGEEVPKKYLEVANKINRSSKLGEQITKKTIGSSIAQGRAAGNFQWEKIGDDLQKEAEKAAKAAAKISGAKAEVVNEVTEIRTRISKDASIKDILPDDYADEAAKVSQRLREMYDAGNTESEEFITLQYKIINLMKEEAKLAGGVHASGAKSSSELRDWIQKDWKRKNDKYDRDAVVSTVWGNLSTSIMKTNNQTESMAEMASWLADLKRINSETAEPRMINETTRALEEEEKQAKAVSYDDKSLRELVEILAQLKIDSDATEDEINSVKDAIKNLLNIDSSKFKSFVDILARLNSKNPLLTDGFRNIEQTVEALEKLAGITNQNKATAVFNDFHEKVLDYQFSDDMSPWIPQDGGKAQKNAYSKVRSELNDMADTVLELQDKYNNFDTNRPVRELEKLEEELRDAEVRFAGTYSAANLFWNEALDRAGNKGGASKKVQDLYGYIMSGSDYYNNDAWERNSKLLENKALNIDEHIEQIFKSLGTNQISSQISEYSNSLNEINQEEKKLHKEQASSPTPDNSHEEQHRKEAEAARDAAKAEEELGNVISTNYSKHWETGIELETLDPDDDAAIGSRMFTTKDKPGRYTTHSLRRLLDDQGQPIVNEWIDEEGLRHTEHMFEVQERTVTRYTEIVREAVNATIDLRKAEHDRAIENQKNNPNQVNLAEYNAQVADATRRLNEAKNAAHDFAEENKVFYNDEEYGSKYLEEVFNNDVDALAAKKLSRENIRYNNAMESTAKKARDSIDGINKKLSDQKIKVDSIQASYNQFVAPGVSKPVTNQKDLSGLQKKRQDILREIQTLQNQPDLATPERLRLLNEEISKYKLLAKIKKETNNPTKRELGGQDLNVAVSQELANYDKAIDKAKSFGDTAKYVTDILKKQKTTLSQTKDVDTLYDSQNARKVAEAELKSLEIAKKRNEIEEKSKRRENIVGLDQDIRLNDLVKYENKLEELGLTSSKTQERVSKLLDILGSATPETGFGEYDRTLRLFKQDMEDSVKAAEKAKKEQEKETTRQDKEREKQSAKELNDLLDRRAEKYKEIREIQRQIADLEKDGNNTDVVARLEKVRESAWKEFNSIQSQLLNYDIPSDSGKSMRDLKQEGDLENFKQQEAILREIYNLKIRNSKINSTSIESIENEEKILELNRRQESLKERIVQETDENVKVEARLLQVEKELSENLEKALVKEMSDSKGRVENVLEKGNWTQEYKDTLQRLINQIDDLNERRIHMDTETFRKELQLLGKDIEDAIGEKSFARHKAAAEVSLAKLENKIEDIMASNSAMGRKFREQFENLRFRLNQADINKSVEDVKAITTEINRLEAELKRTGNTGKSFFSSLRDAAKSSAVQMINMYLSVQDLARYARQAFETVRELDTALVDLKKTTTMSNQDLEEFYQNSSKIAAQTGVTTKEIISQAAAWSRLGYSSKEAATEMAALSSKFAQISPGMDVELATDGLVSNMKAFGVAVEDVEHQIMDPINRIGNTMATSNEEIVQMLKRSSAAMAAANNTFEETLALESAAVQITRNAETTGTALRTISMRIRGKQSLPPYTAMYMLCA